MRAVFAVSACLAISLLSLSVSAIDLEQACNEKFKNINQVSTFLEAVEQLRHLQKLWSPSAPSTKGMRRCIDEYDSIEELGKIMSYDRDVCHPNHIERILSYSRRFMTVSSIEGLKHPFAKNKKMVRHLFRRYALQVALTCRRNMIANLRQVSAKFQESDWIRVMPWLNSTSQSNEIDSGDSFVDDAEGVKIQRGMIEFVDSIEDIDQLIGILPIGVNAITSRPQTTISPAENELFEDAGIEMKRDENVVGTIVVCDKFSRYYETQILSVVRLANAGYKWDGQKLKEQYDQSDDLILRDWYKVTQICQSLRKLNGSYGAGSESEIYHEFSNNRLEHDQQLIDEGFVNKNAVSSFRFFAMEKARRYIRLVSFAVNYLSKRINGENQKQSSTLVKLKTYLDLQTGDRPSTISDGGVLWIMAIVTIVIIAGFALLIWWAVAHHHHHGHVVGGTAGAHAFHAFHGGRG